MKLKNARAGDVLVDNDSDVWYFDGVHFFCLVVDGTRLIEPQRLSRHSLTVRNAKPFKRVTPKKKRHK